MAEVFAHDGTRLHVEVDGAGDPVTVLAHGLTNSCKELSAFTPMAPGTKVRFCFRGHGHSGTPEPGHYRFADFAGDVDVVARTYGATRAVGTSLGQGAITRLLAEQPDRFERLVFILPAALDLPLAGTEIAGFERTADLLETLPTDQAIDEILLTLVLGMVATLLQAHRANVAGGTARTAATQATEQASRRYALRLTPARGWDSKR